MADQNTDFLQQEINRLKNELLEMQEKEKSARRDRSLTLLLTTFKTKFDDLPADVKDSALQEIVNNSLAADNAELAMSDDGQLVLRRKDGSNFFGEDNRLFTPNTYLEKLMTREKILKAAGTEQVIQNTTRANNNTGKSWADKTLNSLVDKSLEALEDRSF